MKKNIICSFLLLATVVCYAQQTETVQNYIIAYKDLAIAEMQRTGVPASIKLAQGIHETMAGTSQLVLKSNNHFGIKCKETWKGQSVRHDDDARGECFRKYSSPEDSYRDHSDFLKTSQRYASLFKLDPTDYQGWAYGLKQAGYATNSKYAPTLIKLIEDYHLQDYTLIALGKKPVNRDITVQLPSDTGYKGTGGFVSINKMIESGEQKHDGNKEAAYQTDKVITAESKEVYIEKVIAKPVYPESEFKLNETRVIYAKKGMSFLALAGQYNIPLVRIFEFNDMKETEAVASDQLIFLQRKRKTGNNEFHIVQPGETLHAIAQQEALRIESLLEYNFLKPGDQPAAGEQLNLRVKSSAKPKMALKENFFLIRDHKIPSAN